VRGNHKKNKVNEPSLQSTIVHDLRSGKRIHLRVGKLQTVKERMEN
jgi:hypothetical protein